MAARPSGLLDLFPDLRLIALLSGAVCTPIALGVSLQFWPVGAPLLLYALLTAVFAYRRPEDGWHWGLWTASGHGLALLLVAAINLLATEPIGFTSAWTWPFLRLATIFSLLPALVGACMGAAAVEVLSRARYELFALLLTAILVISVLAVLFV